MKQLFCLLLILFFYSSNAQQLPANFNLVPNPSFEHNNNGFAFLDTSFINNPLCWVKANAIGSAVYQDTALSIYNPKDITSNTGQGFGLITVGGFNTGYNSNTGFTDTATAYRLYYQTKLLEQLMPNTRYFFSIRVGAYDGSSYLESQFEFIIANIGAHFSYNQIRDYNNIGRINLQPQINFPNWSVPKLDTFVYTKLQGSFIATGGEQYLTIGNFDYFSNMNFAITPTGSWTNFYSDFWIDDIVVTRDTSQPLISLSEFDLGSDTINLCINQTITIGGQPNYFHYWWSTGDTTRFINVSQPGVYWCTVDFGCSTYTDTITVIGVSDTTKPPNPLPDIYLCDDSVEIVTGQSGFISYLWNTGDTSQSITVQTGTFILEMVDNCGITYKDTFHVFDAITSST